MNKYKFVLILALLILTNCKTNDVKRTIKINELSDYIIPCHNSNRYQINEKNINIEDYKSMSIQEKIGYGLPFDEKTLAYIKLDTILNQIIRGDSKLKIDSLRSPEESLGVATFNLDSVLIYELSYGWSQCSCDSTYKVRNFQSCGRIVFSHDDGKYSLSKVQLVY